MIPTEQINAYIGEQDDWKRQIMVRVRQLVHKCDERVEETWRWNGPHFDVNGIMLGMSAHKSFVSVWFHKGSLIKDPKGLFERVEKGSDKGMRVVKFKEGEGLPEAALTALIRSAIALNDKGLKLSDVKPRRKALDVPAELSAAINKDPVAGSHWKGMTYSGRKEFVEWIADAKKEETRKRRIAQAFQMIREGRGRNDKYRD
ncbi:MAG: YdeI/OmpD-associated family protein [Flavobacteriales bacterium]|nr:YdeI/OmpD-associated family protein [Flavobacteriales bacterium]